MIGAVFTLLSQVSRLSRLIVTRSHREASFYSPPTKSPPSSAMSSERLIFLDDTDPSIQYSGSWFLDQGSRDTVGEFGPAQNHTLHGIKTNGSLSFSFNGHLIEVWGTNNSVNTSSGWDPTYQCLVDKVDIGTLDTFPNSNNQILCRAGLNDGPHQLIINVTSTTGQPFWLDGLHYAPSASVSNLPVAEIIVENHDPGLIYSAGWQPLGPDADMTSVNGANCTFNFTGTGLNWFGRIPADHPHNSSSATYSVDGGAPAQFQLVGLPADTNSTLFNQLFFSTPKLPAGPHSLFVAYTGNADQTPLNIDYIVMTNTSSPGATSTSSSGPTISAQPASKSNSTSVGAIVGGVVGGVVAAIIVAFLVFWLIRRRGGESGREQFTGPVPEQYREVQPGSSTSAQAGSLRSAQLEPLRSAQLEPLLTPGLHTARHVVHEDSGIQFSGQDDTVVHLPPEYSKLNPLRLDYSTSN